jgi:hypothetical protein
MSLTRLFLLMISLGFVAQPAMAMDDDDLFLDEDPEEDEDDEIPPTRFEEADAPEEDDDVLEGEEDELDALMGEGEAPVYIDLGLDVDDDEEDDDVVLPPGTDNAAIYSAQVEQLVGMHADEEGMAWEAYLQAYPYSIFRVKIEGRMAELSEAMYQGPRGATAEVGVDNARRELNFSAGMLLEPIDPRSRLRAGFEWGYPSWINLIANYEHQLKRDLSVHGGMSNRLTGWSLEGGVRYAAIKSTRTNFILTVIGDIHLNLAPIAPGLRPMLAVGKRFEFGGDVHMDVQAQIGSDLMMFPGMLSPRWLSGLNVTVAPSETVNVFMELTSVIKDMGSWHDSTGSFRFNQMAFGLRFQGKSNTVVGTGAAVPVSTNYWRYHYGSVMADYQHYM